MKLDNIMQSWEVHIPGMAPNIEVFYATLIEQWNFKQTNLEMVWENVGGLFGKKKRMMKIEWNSYCCYIGAEAFGIDLFCTWQLYHPNYSAQETADNTIVGLFISDFNEINEVKAFASVCRDCAVKAAEKLFDQSEQDKTNLKRPSSGVLGPL